MAPAQFYAREVRPSAQWRRREGGAHPVLLLELDLATRDDGGRSTASKAGPVAHGRRWFYRRPLLLERRASQAGPVAHGRTAVVYRRPVLLERRAADHRLQRRAADLQPTPPGPKKSSRAACPRARGSSARSIAVASPEHDAASHPSYLDHKKNLAREDVDHARKDRGNTETNARKRPTLVQEHTIAILRFPIMGGKQDEALADVEIPNVAGSRFER